MLNQIKYSARQSLNLRLWALGIVVVLNIVFIVLGSMGLSGLPGMIMSVTGVSLTSLALAALLVIMVIADVKVFRSLFAAPGAYTTLLVPVPGWKILWGKMIPMVVFDLTALGIGIAGVVVQGLSVANIALEWGDFGFLESGMEMIGSCLLLGLGNYLLLITSIFLVCALVKSVFFCSKVKGLLGVASFLAIHYVLSFLDLLLLPAAPYTQFGFVFSLEIVLGFNAGMVCYMCLLLVKIIAMFAVTAHLMDRRINL